MDISKLSFQFCDACVKVIEDNLDVPICSGCLHNRLVINTLTELEKKERRALVALPRALAEAVEKWTAEYVNATP